MVAGKDARNLAYSAHAKAGRAETKPSPENMRLCDGEKRTQAASQQGRISFAYRFSCGVNTCVSRACCEGGTMSDKVMHAHSDRPMSSCTCPLG